MLVSQTGSWMQMLGQQWLVLQLTDSALWLGIVGFCSSIPVLFLSMFAGALADRMNKRHLIIITQAAAMVQALVLAILTSTGLVQTWHVVICALALGVINSFDRPARQSFVVELVGKEDLANAIALNSMIFNGSRIFGPSLAGILIAIPRVGPAGAFWVNAISFLAVIASLLYMDHRPGPTVARSQSMRANIVEGLRYARTSPTVSTLLLLATITSVFGMSYNTMMPIMARDVLKVGAAGQGVMMTCVGAGAMLGLLALASFGSAVRKGRIFIASNLLFPPMLLIVAFSRSFPLTLAALLVMGGAIMVQNATTNTLLQTEVPDHLRGRVMGLYNVTFNGMMPFGSLQTGIVANAFGAPIALAVGGIVLFSRALWLTARAKHIRDLA
jgi:MFS family permease